MSMNSLKVELRGGIYYVSGDLNESADLSPLKVIDEPLLIDLGGLGRINSKGILAQLAFVNDRGDHHFEFHNCPMEFIYNINLIPSILGNAKNRPGSVVSILFAHECPDCDQKKNMQCEVASLKTEDGRIILPPLECPGCGTVMDGEEDDASLLSFIETD